jgi:hypothetical protein
VSGIECKISHTPLWTKICGNAGDYRRTQIFSYTTFYIFCWHYSKKKNNTLAKQSIKQYKMKEFETKKYI